MREGQPKGVTKDKTKKKARGKSHEGESTYRKQIIELLLTLLLASRNWIATDDHEARKGAGIGGKLLARVGTRRVAKATGKAFSKVQRPVIRRKGKRRVLSSRIGAGIRRRPQRSAGSKASIKWRRRDLIVNG